MTDPTAAPLPCRSPITISTSSSDAARPLRILAEYLAPFDTFMREGVRDTIVIFGSARVTEDGPFGRYYEGASWRG